MNCAIYIRKSRENNEKPGYRLTVQREQLPEYAKSHGWSATLYDDGHASAARGKVSSLPQRAKLEKDIRAGKIKIILVIELSRLSRDDTMQDYVAWLTLCADHGVKLATMSRILDPSQHSDWMLLLMEGGFSSVEMKVLAGRMEEGRRQAFLAGKWLGGICPKPYRYDKAEKKVVVDETKLAEIETIWTLAETLSAKAIAEKLNLPEISIRRTISDDRLLFYQGLRLDPETGNEIRCEWEPVMSKARADRIRSSRRTRKTNSTRRDAAGLLSALGIFRCGYCDRTVKSWTNSKIRLDGTRLDYYACVTKNKKNACPKSKMINHQTVNTKVVSNILNTLAKGEELKEYWQQAQKSTTSDSQRDILEKIKSEERKKENLVNAIAEGLIEFTDAKQKMEEIKNNISFLQDSLEDIKPNTEPNWNSLLITSEDYSLLDFADQREIISSLLESITLFNTYAILKYTFPRTISGSYTARINFQGKSPRPTLRRNSTKA